MIKRQHIQTSYLQVRLSQEAVKLFGLFRAARQRSDVNQQLHEAKSDIYNKRLPPDECELVIKHKRRVTWSESPEA